MNLLGLNADRYVKVAKAEFLEALRSSIGTSFSHYFSLKSRSILANWELMMDLVSYFS